MANEILTALDDIHQAILSGNFVELPALSGRLEAALTGVDASDARLTEEVRKKTQRNRDCLAAALRGMRAANQRISDIRKASQGLTTYDRRGTTSLLSAFPTLGRRA